MMKRELVNFRRTEAMLTAAGLSSVDVLMSVIGLALETMQSAASTDPHPERGPHSIPFLPLVDRLGWNHAEAAALLRQADAELEMAFGLPLCSDPAIQSCPAHPSMDGSEECLHVMLSELLTTIIRGSALLPLPSGSSAALTVDDAAAIEIDLVTKIAGSGGGALLYREPETAGERQGELLAAAAAIAAHPLAGSVLVQGRLDATRPALSPAAALIAASLYGASVLVMTDMLVEAKAGSTAAVEDDEVDTSPATPTGWQALTYAGQKLVTLLPHAPLAVLVPIPRDAVLSPRAAAAFVTAIGPFRRDRTCAMEEIESASGGRLGTDVAGQLADLWENRPDRAATCLDAVTRMVEHASRYEGSGLSQANPCEHSRIFSTLATAFVQGITPHVWAPNPIRPKPNVGSTFHRELFVCAPDTALLFSPHLREETGIRIMLAGPPGTGKTVAAAYVANHVLDRPSLDVTMSEILHHRLGAMERAIARAFSQARDRGAVLILDEADSIAADRASASPNAAHLVTAMTNQLLIEMDRHALPIILCTNFSDRIDPAVKRRIDWHAEVQPIPPELERRALQLILELDAPEGFAGFGGDTVVADYTSAKRIARLQGGGTEVAIAAVRRARDVRLGRAGEKRRIGF